MAPPSPDGLSVIVRCLRDPQTGTLRLRVERIDRQEEIQLNDGIFLVRVAFDRGGMIKRCLIRHLASGREAYVQGGPGLSTFVKQSLLADR